MIKTILLISNTIFSVTSTFSTNNKFNDLLFSYKEPTSQTKSVLFVQTPNGTNVQVFCDEEMLTPSDIAEIDEYYDTAYPNAVRLSSATSKYNCHSYAWYQQSDKNPYWMNDPSAYWEDGSYAESKGNAGDIVVYYDGNQPIHSGVVERRVETYTSSLSDLENIQVTSKRGKVGLYSHLGSDSPYKTSTTRIEYFTLNSHSHVFDSYQWLNYKQHKAICSCGYKITQGHVVASGSFSNGERYANCLSCGGLATMGFVVANSSDINNLFEYIDGSYYVKETTMIGNILNLSYKEYQEYVKNNC